jgi:hypothetical protein
LSTRSLNLSASEALAVSTSASSNSRSTSTFSVTLRLRLRIHRHPRPSPYRAIAFNRLSTNATSGYGIATPDLDFFRNACSTCIASATRTMPTARNGSPRWFSTKS